MSAATSVLDAIEQQVGIVEPTMRHSSAGRLFVAGCICASMMTLLLLVAAANSTNAGDLLADGPTDYYGKSIDQLVLLGQNAIGETGRNKVGLNGIYHASAVLVDRSAPADKLYIYVADTGNNRILGFDYSCEISGTCQMDGTRPASIVLGQPNTTTASCNGDNNLGSSTSHSAQTRPMGKVTPLPTSFGVRMIWNPTEGIEVPITGLRTRLMTVHCGSASGRPTT